jgi:phosphatidylserine/phosphatidylglycerophosphate/cardiolipin synthase-like enzyme
MKQILLSSIMVLIIISSPAFAAGPVFEDAFSPQQGATELVVKTIKEARTTIHVAAYSFTSQPIIDALVIAHDRGVDVDIVLDKSQRNGKGSLFKYIKDHGVPTRINDHYAIMHNKFLVIDGETLELGSFNYTVNAEKRNAENVLVLHHVEKIVEDYDRQWKKLWNEGVEK